MKPIIVRSHSDPAQMSTEGIVYPFHSPNCIGVQAPSVGSVNREPQPENIPLSDDPESVSRLDACSVAIPDRSAIVAVEGVPVSSIAHLG